MAKFKIVLREVIDQDRSKPKQEKLDFWSKGDHVIMDLCGPHLGSLVGSDPQSFLKFYTNGVDIKSQQLRHCWHHFSTRLTATSTAARIMWHLSSGCNHLDQILVFRVWLREESLDCNQVPSLWVWLREVSLGCNQVPSPWRVVRRSVTPTTWHLSKLLTSLKSQQFNDITKVATTLWHS